MLCGVPNTAIQHFSIDVATVFADLSGIGTATAYLENISSKVSIYLFLFDDIVKGPTRSMHRTSLTFNARFSKVSTFFKFIFEDKIKVNSVYLNEPKIHVIVNQEGKANWDIAITSEEKEEEEKPEDESVSLISINLLVVSSLSTSSPPVSSAFSCALLARPRFSLSGFKSESSLLI